MLKRLRPASPPPALDIPFIPDVIPDSHRRKRPRILPPSLNGEERHAMHDTNEDDGEEDDDEAEIIVNHNAPGVGPSGSTAPSTEYQSANTFLHDLHALHRHRLIFSPPSLSPALQPGHSPAPRYPEKSCLPTTPDYPHLADKKDGTGLQDFRCELPPEEVQRVKERYEETNKLLGYLFLTRRKQLVKDST
ncbi:hypothetical protein GGX14DRAFT_422139 [Mycena pura]|uniref:Uncharacterized protein n=1 Tax=Mycena pura TaxID=153505 RepID=A0AAD6YQB4_9AGAR|nr:hypothetical protein GGX14DRAFT_422139 [Mycena pura]